MKTQPDIHYPTWLLHRFIINLEKNLILRNGSTSAFDQIKSFWTDEIDKLDLESSIGFQDHADPPHKFRMTGYLLAADKRLGALFISLSRRKASYRLLDHFYQEAGGGNARVSKWDYHNMQKSSCQKVDWSNRKVSELQFLNKQVRVVSA